MSSAAAVVRLRYGIGSVRESVGLYVGLGVIATLLILAFFVPTPYNPLTPHPADILQPPSSQYWFGTDSLGRDVFSRTIAGARLDLPLVLIATAISLAIGVPLGIAAASRSRWSAAVMRPLDMLQAFPLIILAITLVALAGNHTSNVVIAIALISTPQFIRLARAETLSLKEARFVEAAHAFGASQSRIVRRYLLPNISGVVLAQASLTAATAILVIAGMSFLGIGIRPPTASWGAMIQEGSDQVTSGQWWDAVFPGVAILITVLSLNLIAEGLERRFGRQAGR